MGKFGACVDGTLTWIGNNKLSTFLGLVAFSLMVSTWTLAAINSNIEKDLQSCRSELNPTEAPTDAPPTDAPPTNAPTDAPPTNAPSEAPTAAPTEAPTAAPTEAPTDSPSVSPEETLRLSEFALPTYYDLFLIPDLTPWKNDETNTTGKFKGTVKITLDVRKPTKEIVLHSNKLMILNVTFTAPDDLSIRVTNFALAPKQEQLTVTLSGEIPVASNYDLDIEFSGVMTDEIIGFYGSTYKDDEGNDRYIATSKFEPTFARQSFPCFDEPSMKAKFKISLVRPAGNGYSALSNMDQISEEEYADGLVKVNFRESVPMSTYLTVFIVSDFLSKSATIEPVVGDNFELRCFATPAQVDKLDFALQTSIETIKYLIDYFKIPYPLPKLDLAAIPDFVSGAMETWGLVTYRETNLLYDREVSSTANKQRIAAVIAHEFTHMWFGNLVTMKWWSDLWLNEGFASYIEFKGINAAHPDWKIEDQFTIDTMHSVMNLDATLGSHPIVVGVETPDQITEIFDSITYNKGASIIRMMEDFIGPEDFQTGVSAYLDANKYMNADSNDLLKQLEGKIPEDVTAILNTWIRQKGYPFVTVEATSENFRLTQTRFLTDPEAAERETVDSEYGYKWSIPITYTTSKNTTDVQRQWFHHTQNEMIIPIVPSSVDWIKINKDQIGYYRVKYDQSMWQSLNKALEEDIDSMSVLDRAHLLHDAFSLAEALQVPYSTALTMTKYLKSETHFVPWDVASSKLKNIRNLLYYTEHYQKFREYVVNLVDEAYNSISMDVNPDEHLVNMFRNTILDLACSMDHPKCMELVGKLFTEWINSETRETSRPAPDLRSLVYYHGMRSVGTQKEWDILFEIFAKEADASEKTKLQSALAAVSEPWILRKLIDLASADETYVRKQDYFTLMGSISANRHGEALVWDYVREHWPQISTRFGLNERNLGRMIPTITSRFTTEAKLNEMKAFFEQYPEAGAGASARVQALEAVQNNINWLAKNKQSIGDWLKL